MVYNKKGDIINVKALKDITRQLSFIDVKNESHNISINYTGALLAIRHHLNITSHSRIAGRFIEDDSYGFFVGYIDKKYIKYNIPILYRCIIFDSLDWSYFFVNQNEKEFITLPVANTQQYKAVGNLALGYRLIITPSNITFRVHIRGEKYYKRYIDPLYKEGDYIVSNWVEFYILPKQKTQWIATSDLSHKIDREYIA